MAQITNLSFGQNCRRNGLSIPAIVDVEASLMAAIRGLYFRKRSSSVTSDWTQAEWGVSIHSADGFYNLEIPALVDDLADGVALANPREDVDFVALDALGAKQHFVCNLARN